MYQYNQTNQETGTCLPLLMGYTQPEKVLEAENEEPVRYDQKLQIAIIHPFVMRTVGTKSKKCVSTKPKKKGICGTSDTKNLIDDSKTVK